MNNLNFEIPFGLPGLNEYINSCRTSRYKASSEKIDVEDSIMWVLKQKKFKLDCPVFIDFIWYEQTERRDKDNVAFAKKFILDAMQKAKVLVNDNNRYILGFTDSFVYGRGNKVKVIVRLEKEKE